MATGFQVSGSDAIRAYIMVLRAEQKIGQEKVANAIGMAVRTYKAWESGAIKDMKAPLIVRAFRFLGGDLDHLEDLERADEETAAQMARERLRLTAEQRIQADRIQAKMRRVIELGEQDPDRLIQVVERLRADVQADPALLDMVMAYLDGRRSRPMS